MKCSWLRRNSRCCMADSMLGRRFPETWVALRDGLGRRGDRRMSSFLAHSLKKEHTVTPKSPWIMTSCDFNTTRDRVCGQGGRGRRMLKGMSGKRRQDLPCVRIPLVVRWTGRINALVASSHVEAHAVLPTAHILLPTLINI